jgi:hypothetical protein
MVFTGLNAIGPFDQWAAVSCCFFITRMDAISFYTKMTKKHIQAQAITDNLSDFPIIIER